MNLARVLELPGGKSEGSFSIIRGGGRGLVVGGIDKEAAELVLERSRMIDTFLTMRADVEDERADLGNSIGPLLLGSSGSRKLVARGVPDVSSTSFRAGRGLPGVCRAVSGVMVSSLERGEDMPTWAAAIT